MVFESCRKAEQPATENKPASTVESVNQRFFQQRLSTNSSVMAVTNFVKRENNKYKFAGKLIEKIGLPYWDKALVFTQKASAGRLSSSDETIVYVPFVQESQQHVNASLIVKLGISDTTFRILCDWQYAEHGFGPATDSTWNARDVFNIFATLNKEVFNSTTYKINDDRLFGSPGNDRITVIKVKAPDFGNSARWVPITICNMVDVCYGPDWYNSWCNGGCTTDCEFYTHSEMECSVTWVQIPDGDTGGGGGGGGGNGDNGGGGGGGCAGDCGGWNPPDPCSNGQPCDSPGWEPVSSVGGDEYDQDLDPLSYPESQEILLFEQDYRGQMSVQELAIFDNMPRLNQLHYLFNAKSALDWAQSLYPTSVHNGNGDAFRHAYFSAMNAKILGVQLAKQLGDAHETFPNSNPLENQMDLFNNQYGRDLFLFLSQNGMGGHFFKETVIGILKNHRIPNGELRKLSPLGPNSEILPNSQLVSTD